MLIALFGPPGAGKDTVAKRLVEQHGFVRVAFADKVRELAYEVLNAYWKSVITEVGWERAKRNDPEIRKLLERVGDGTRRVLGDDVWIDAIRYQVLNTLRNNGNVVITDLRKENEKWFVNALDLHIFGKSKLWYVTRPGCHKRPFDEWKPEWAAFTIYNNDTIEVLNQRVDEVLELCQ
jgi:hypothetical protein